MLKSIKSGRDRLAAKFSGSLSSTSCSSTSSTEEATSRQQDVNEGMVHQSHGHVRMQGQKSSRVSWSSAGYQAKSPFGDINIHQADKQHILAAVFTCQPSAQGGRYLQRTLAKELAVQIRQHEGDVRAALPAALSALNQAYRNLHSFNGPVLENVQAAIVYADLRNQVLHTASNGGCRVVVGRSLADGGVYTVADIGRESSQGANSQGEETSSIRSKSSEQQQDEALRGMHFATVKLRPGIDTVLLGSQGLWHELPSHKALLRLRHYHEAAPSATGGNAAAHLTNFALHTVARRSTRLSDPRMRSLKSVSHLQSLYTGDRSGYKYSRRQPVRRRRGDVHGDLSAIVLHIDHPDEGAPQSKAASARTRIAKLLPGHHLSSSLSGNSSSVPPTSERALRHWDLLRMHFVDYPRQSSALTRTRWAELVETALEEARAQRHRRNAAELLLRTGLFGGSPPPSRPASRAASLGPWQPAGWEALGRPSRPATAAADAATPLEQSLLPEVRAPSVPSGQPLESPEDSLSGSSPEISSHALSGSSWQPVGGSMIPRTISRRQLFVPVPAQLQLPGLKELPDAQQEKGAPHNISDEWLAHELHRKLSQELLHEGLQDVQQKPAIHA
ncbi:g11437 [Coccomyxa elongata]